MAVDVGLRLIPLFKTMAKGQVQRCERGKILSKAAGGGARGREDWQRCEPIYKVWDRPCQRENGSGDWVGSRPNDLSVSMKESCGGVKEVKEATLPLYEWDGEGKVEGEAQRKLVGKIE